MYASGENPIQRGSCKVLCVVFNKSYRAMMTTNDVSLNAEIRILTEGGITSLSAWGKMIKRMVW